MSMLMLLVACGMTPSDTTSTTEPSTTPTETGTETEKTTTPTADTGPSTTGPTGETGEPTGTETGPYLSKECSECLAATDGCDERFTKGAKTCSDGSCDAYIDCMLKTDCYVTGTDMRDCYCGGVKVTECFVDGGKGQCKDVIEKTCGTDVPIAIGAIFFNPNESIGAVNGVLLCFEFCAEECATSDIPWPN